MCAGRGHKDAWEEGETRVRSLCVEWAAAEGTVIWHGTCLAEASMSICRQKYALATTMRRKFQSKSATLEHDPCAGICRPVDEELCLFRSILFLLDLDFALLHDSIDFHARIAEHCHVCMLFLYSVLLLPPHFAFERWSY